MGKHFVGLLILGGVMLAAGCAPRAMPVRAPMSPPASPSLAAPVSPADLPASAVTPLPTVTKVSTAEVALEADEESTLADVRFVRARLQPDGTWTFEVTVQHEDTGWEHYADRWEVLASGDEVLATRVLAHPHVDEQPFTRSQSGIVIPEVTSQVRVRAHDGVHGYGGREVVVDLTVAKGLDFDVNR